LQIREGLKDYEYCQLLAQAGEREFANATARRVARSWTDWDERPSELEAAREQLARRLVERSSRGKKGVMSRET
jgi:hypothetical protein